MIAARAAVVLTGELAMVNGLLDEATGVFVYAGKVAGQLTSCTAIDESFPESERARLGWAKYLTVTPTTKEQAA